MNKVVKKAAVSKKKNVKKVYTLDDLLDKHIGQPGTTKRDRFDGSVEDEIKLYKLGDALKKLRLAKEISQEQLGEMIGVQKARISKLEKNMANANMAAIISVFRALGAEIDFKIRVAKP